MLAREESPAPQACACSMSLSAIEIEHGENVILARRDVMASQTLIWLAVL